MSVFSKFRIERSGVFSPEFELITNPDYGRDSVSINASILKREFSEAVGNAPLGFGGANHLSIKGDIDLVGDASNLFRNFVSVDGLEHLDTSQVTNMNHMFSWCDNMEQVDLSGWDTSNVTDMSYMFSNCRELKSFDFSDIDTSSLTDAVGMFNKCYSLESVEFGESEFPVLSNSLGMFSECESLGVMDVTNVSLNHVFDIDFPANVSMTHDMLAKNGSVITSQIDFGGSEDCAYVSWLAEGGYKSGGALVDKSVILERIEAAEQVKSSKSKDTSLVADGQVLGSSIDSSKTSLVWMEGKYEMPEF